MEDLVAEEVRNQMAQLSPRLTQYIKRGEVETYALNHLPTLYASSREGWLHQQKRGRVELHNQIKTSVRQALMAVQRDPLRSSTPLVKEQHQEEPEAKVLEEPVTMTGGQSKQTPTHPYYWQQESQAARNRRRAQ
ncbi:MAG: late competence development ComFB family protein [Oscillatoriales cyanobacterium RM2_1_1]|nr:late competence development ComFB family protein [Oscillatoriales cyanobacterium SM2_3_0]NJO45488.1 late competence development ComFB family protein [Oscillatoriales cyanobacterium RM2_1_1]